MPAYKPCIAPTLAADIIANNAIGTAWAKLRLRLNTSKGMAKIELPAPVSAKTRPINKPSNTLEVCKSTISIFFAIRSTAC